MGQKYQLYTQYTRQKSAQIAIEAARPEKKVVPKVSEPEKFRGDRNKYEVFVTQLALKFASNPAAFVDDNSKINYAALLLTDRAYDWLQPHINKTNGIVDIASYDVSRTSPNMAPPTTQNGQPRLGE